MCTQYQSVWGVIHICVWGVRYVWGVVYVCTCVWGVIHVCGVGLHVHVCIKRHVHFWFSHTPIVPMCMHYKPYIQHTTPPHTQCENNHNIQNTPPHTEDVMLIRCPSTTLPCAVVKSPLTLSVYVRRPSVRSVVGSTLLLLALLLVVVSYTCIHC